MQAARRTYLDHNATAPIRPGVVEAVCEALMLTGNPSSVHQEGRAARAAIERAREQVAALVGARARDVVFTSGGTEANATLLRPSPGAGRLLVGATEHASVRDGHRFPPDRVEVVPVLASGLVDLAELERRLARIAPERALVSMQAANNETGVVQPLAELARLTRAHGAVLHADAVQALGKVPVDVAALGADAITLSAHKIGGPKGVGAIVLAFRGAEAFEPLIRGGGQERGLRAGTENLPGIVGFGAAAEAVRHGFAVEAARIGCLRDACEAALRRIAPGTVVLGAEAERLPNTLLFSIPGLSAETALIRFDLEGVAVSSGAACSSGKVRRSHVLDVMGVAPDLAAGAIRVSLGWTSTEEDVKSFARACERIAASLYERKASAA